MQSRLLMVAVAVLTSCQQADNEPESGHDSGLCGDAGCVVNERDVATDAARSDVGDALPDIDLGRDAGTTEADADVPGDLGTTCNLVAEGGSLQEVFTEAEPFGALMVDVPEGASVDWVFGGWDPLSSVSGPPPEVDRADSRRILPVFQHERGYYVAYSVNDGECEGRHYFYRNIPGALMVALEWRTPGADDESEFGTDLDLHFVHPNGTWQQAPWDLYWRTLIAEWGPPGPPGDAYLVEGPNNHGPEVVVMELPEDVTYDIGVYYYSDVGAGETAAALRLFVGTDPLVLTEAVLPAEGWFWHGGSVQYTAQAFNEIGTLSEGFPLD